MHYRDSVDTLPFSQELKQNTKKNAQSCKKIYELLHAQTTFRLKLYRRHVGRQFGQQWRAHPNKQGLITR